jgi:hypothetical protein
MALAAASSDTNSLVAGFLAGALLPTLAYGLFWRNQASKINNDGDDEEDDDEDDDDDDDDSSEDEFPSSNKTAQQWGMSDAPYKVRSPSSGTLSNASSLPIRFLSALRNFSMMNNWLVPVE